MNTYFGISLRETNSVVEDHNGFIWSSSKAGIIRISDNNYKLYQPPFVESNISRIKIATQGEQIFIYTNNGQVFIYDEVYDCFKMALNIVDHLKINFLWVYDIIVDEYGKFWIATNIGLFSFDDKLEEIEAVRDPVFTMTRDESYLYLITEKKIIEFNINTGIHSVCYENLDDFFYQARSVFYDNQKMRLWIGTRIEGLFYYDLTDKKLKKSAINNLPRQPILAIKNNKDSALIIGIDGNGVWETDRNVENIINIFKEDPDDINSLRGNGVYDLFCDSRNRIWVTTYTGGLSVLDRNDYSIKMISHKVNTQNSLGDDNVNSIIEDDEGNLWLGTDNGISKWNLEIDKWEHFHFDKNEGSNVFLSLCQDNEGRIWAGTYSSGLYIIDNKTGKKIENFPNNKTPEFKSRFITSIYKDCIGDIWIADALSRVICYSCKEKKFRTYMAKNIFKFSEIDDKRMLLGCSYGLIELDKESGEMKYLLNEYYVKDIIIENDDYWIATSGNGIIRYNPVNKETDVFTMKSGLPSNFVNNIIRNGNELIFTTENGLCIYSIKDGKFLPHQISLPSISYNSGAYSYLTNGDFALGTNKGIAIFNPKITFETKPSGKIFIQDIKISGQSIRDDENIIKGLAIDKHKELKLKYFQNNLNIELINIGIKSQEIKYAWKLNGHEQNLCEATNNSVINYTNLPTGNFKLEIVMYDNSLTQIIDRKNIDVIITPPLWNTLWFKSLVCFIIIFVLLFLLKTYINRLKHNHIKDKIRFFTNIAHDIRTSLTLINAPIEELYNEINLTEKSRKYLDIARDQSIKLSNVATQLLDFEKSDIGKDTLNLEMTDIVELCYKRKLMFDTIAQKKNIRILFSSDMNSYLTGVDHMKIEKIIDNLLSNAIKYSLPENIIEVSIMTSKKEWCFVIKDYGTGISEKNQKRLFKEFYREESNINANIVGSGIGLLLVKNYVSMHDGEIYLESKENKGTTFKIHMPFKKISKSNLDYVRNKEVANSTITDILDDNNENKTFSADNPHLLIVEDNIDLQKFIRSALSEQYNVTCAENGAEALSKISKILPDIIISDIMMPEMDGFELCYNIKSKFETSHIPVLLLTALSDKVYQLKGLGYGADDYLTKPFDMQILRQKIDSIIKNRKIIREKALKMISITVEDPVLLENELDDKFVKKAISVIKENISNNDFSREDFAARMNVSSSLLYNKIKLLTDQTPIELIKTVRLNYALELLKTRKHPVTEVSELCGYSSISYFSTVFKKHFGKNPTEIFND